MRALLESTAGCWHPCTGGHLRSVRRGGVVTAPARPEDAEIVAALRELARHRGPDKTFCPSEAARLLDRDAWRALMPEVRRVAANIGLWALQRGLPVDPTTARGPNRLGSGK